jgi:hypothetical protein
MTARVTESRTDGNEPNGEASVCRLLQTFPLGSFPSVLLSSVDRCPTFFLLSSVLLSSTFFQDEVRQHLEYFTFASVGWSRFWELFGHGDSACG